MQSQAKAATVVSALSELEQVDALASQMGDLIEFRRASDDRFVLLIRRTNPTFKDRPYMTIRARLDHGADGMYWGHYDLTADDAHADLERRS
jgi:hypothetical protein